MELPDSVVGAFQRLGSHTSLGSHATNYVFAFTTTSALLFCQHCELLELSSKKTRALYRYSVWAQNTFRIPDLCFPSGSSCHHFDAWIEHVPAESAPRRPIKGKKKRRKTLYYRFFLVDRILELRSLTGALAGTLMHSWTGAAGPALCSIRCTKLFIFLFPFYVPFNSFSNRWQHLSEWSGSRRRDTPVDSIVCVAVSRRSCQFFFLFFCTSFSTKEDTLCSFTR